MSYFIKNKTKKAVKAASTRVSCNVTVAGGGHAKSYKTTKPASKFYQNSVICDAQDEGVTLFKHTPVANTATDGVGSDMYDFKQMVVHNSSPQTAEIMIKIEDWAHATNDSADGTQTELKMLLGPRQTFMLPTSKLIQYSAANSAANSTIRHYWDDGTIDEDGDHEYPGQKDPLNGLNNGGSHNGAIIDTHNSSAVGKTDDLGNYNYTRLTDTASLANSNFFGQAADGIVPGSISIRLAEYPALIINLASMYKRKAVISDESKLAKSTSFQFGINVDGAGAVQCVFSTDSLNTKWGGTNGVISKINTALKSLAETSGTNMFGKKVVCKMMDGDLWFLSQATALHHNNGGTQSSVVLSAGSSGVNLYAGSGMFPNLGTASNQITVKPKFTPWEAPDAIIWDDSQGNLRRQKGGVGTINYSTGMIQLTGLPPNTEMNIIAITDSALGGESTTLGAGQGTDNANTIVHVKARSTNLYRPAKIDIFVAGN
tara:strand:- start:19832 stop:21289 length:1458 start_codon:yes stop_codon:yes gene_type:complete